jgi:hypothetical protein|nr:MAG TPA: hypothetical protein [Caudoviricetes sp.]
MNEAKKYELIGRIVEQKEIARKLGGEIGELKEAIVSSLNGNFLSSVWDELSKSYKEKNILLNDALQKMKIYEDELKNV